MSFELATVLANEYSKLSLHRTYCTAVPCECGSWIPNGRFSPGIYPLSRGQRVLRAVRRFYRRCVDFVLGGDRY